MVFRLLLISILFLSFQPIKTNEPFVVVLGIAQDAGYPQVGCDKECCKKYWDKKAARQNVSCIALFDPATKQKWLFDATPDFTSQVHETDMIQKGEVSGIFITHAHIGHYTGLMYLGKESKNSNKLPVYVMPRMTEFLQKNGPWSQLVSLNNISLQLLREDDPVKLTENISVIPILIPHRDEFSETVGFGIRTGTRSLLYIPDIDKWQKWRHDLKQMVKDYDYLILDGSFYKDGELPGRNMAEIPHPFVEETMDLLKDLTVAEKRKIWFIHFNHTNPLIDKNSESSKQVKNRGFNVCYEGLKFLL